MPSVNFDPPELPHGISLRTAAPDDAAALLAIYAPIVRDTSISFETQVPTTAEFAARIAAVLERHQWLVAEQAAGALVGYAYGGPHRARAAYRYATETSVYVAPEAQGAGVGRALYEQLFADLVRLGYFHAYAGITLPNSASDHLHHACGFTEIGRFPRVGFKHGRWHDVGWYHRELRAGLPDTTAVAHGGDAR